MPLQYVASPSPTNRLPIFTSLPYPCVSPEPPFEETGVPHDGARPAKKAKRPLAARPPPPWARVLGQTPPPAQAPTPPTPMPIMAAQPCVSQLCTSRATPLPTSPLLPQRSFMRPTGPHRASPLSTECSAVQMPGLTTSHSYRPPVQCWTHSDSLSSRASLYHWYYLEIDLPKAHLLVHTTCRIFLKRSPFLPPPPHRCVLPLAPTSPVSIHGKCDLTTLGRSIAPHVPLSDFPSHPTSPRRFTAVFVRHCNMTNHHPLHGPPDEPSLSHALPLRWPSVICCTPPLMPSSALPRHHEHVYKAPAPGGGPRQYADRS